MKLQLREYENRFPHKNLTGAVMNITKFMAEPMALRMYNGGNQAWFVPERTYPSGKILIIEISPEELLSQPVLRFVNRTPLMEGDEIYIKGEKETVIKVKEGDGSPYPIVTTKSQYKWDEVQTIIKKEVKL